ncbi:unnamed protein product [Diabrotica balteata]|uniref:Uncharacterized protein n=1 Tax=Diabrotica balteata TaxID=107213 RepID=A0A9N9T6W7_DIABA|nr:unnamed protein product [Diabrotica balteata]
MSDTAVTREDIPLKKGKTNRKWYTCGDEDCISGSKYVNIAFGTLTVIITLALIIQINYGDYQRRSDTDLQSQKEKSAGSNKFLA